MFLSFWEQCIQAYGLRGLLKSVLLAPEDDLGTDFTRYGRTAARIYDDEPHHFSVPCVHLLRIRIRVIDRAEAYAHPLRRRQCLRLARRISKTCKCSTHISLSRTATSLDSTSSDLSFQHSTDNLLTGL